MNESDAAQERPSGPVTDELFARFMDDLERMHHRDDQHVDEPHLVTHSADARWLRGATDNPSHLGLLPHLPMRTVEFFLQVIPGGTASDLQRHAHESVHYVIDGSGHSEIGDQVVPWAKGDFVYTPPWIWHRHYADDADVHMIIIENSRLLTALDTDFRASLGSVSFAATFGDPLDQNNQSGSPHLG